MDPTAEPTTTRDSAAAAGGLEAAVGDTPLVRVPSLSAHTGHTVLAKCEWLNPMGSPKDRIARAMIRGAEEEGRLLPWAARARGVPDVVIEGTVGSTGISLAALCNARGYRCIIFMPDDQAQDKYDILQMLGAQVIQCRPCSIIDPQHYVNRARALAEEMNAAAAAAAADPSPDDHHRAPLPRALFCDQFENPRNFQCHLEETGPELHRQFLALFPPSPAPAPVPSFPWWPEWWRPWWTWALHQWWRAMTPNATKCISTMPQSPSPHALVSTISLPPTTIDALVLGAGTGGTIGGMSAYLKAHFPRLRTILADPQGSSFYWRIKHGVLYNPLQAEGTRKRHQVDTIVEGVGGNRMVRNVAAALPYVDDAVTVTDQQAVDAARMLLREDGFFVGSSSAVNAAAVLQLAPSLPPGSVIITMFCDPGSRHLSKFWNPAYLAEAGIT